MTKTLQRLLCSLSACLVFVAASGLSGPSAEAQNRVMKPPRPPLCEAELAQIAVLAEEIEGQHAQISAQQADIQARDARISDLERRKFLMVTISWGGQEGDDVDLHVVDPNGNEYYFGARTHPGSDARFEEDSLNGPGNEVWLAPQGIPGEYRIYYNPYHLESSEVRVRGRVVHPTARHEFREQRLAPNGNRQLVATVVLDNEGNVRVSG